MQPSMFNVRVPLDDRNEVFLMNTFTDAQLIVSTDVADLLDRVERGTNAWTSDERDALATLAENGFIVEDRDTDRRNVRDYFRTVRESREQLRMTVLTTLQCNFACDYCIQGDHGDYNKHAAKMSLEKIGRASCREGVEGQTGAGAGKREDRNDAGKRTIMRASEDR